MDAWWGWRHLLALDKGGAALNKPHQGFSFVFLSFSPLHPHLPILPCLAQPFEMSLCRISIRLLRSSPPQCNPSATFFHWISLKTTYQRCQNKTTVWVRADKVVLPCAFVCWCYLMDRVVIMAVSVVRLFTVHGGWSLSPCPNPLSEWQWSLSVVAVSFRARPQSTRYLLLGSIPRDWPLSTPDIWQDGGFDVTKC